MRASVLVGPERSEVREVPVPAVGGVVVMVVANAALVSYVSVVTAVQGC